MSQSTTDSRSPSPVGITHQVVYMSVSSPVPGQAATSNRASRGRTRPDEERRQRRRLTNRNSAHRVKHRQQTALAAAMAQAEALNQENQELKQTLAHLQQSHHSMQMQLSAWQARWLGRLEARAAVPPQVARVETVAETKPPTWTNAQVAAQAALLDQLRLLEADLLDFPPINIPAMAAMASTTEA